MLKKDFGLKKNLLRVKQLADQGLGRAEKTEVLSEDLQNAEKKVEGLKLVLHGMVKKLSLSLQAYNVQDADKRTKKMPSMVLGLSLMENSTQLGEGMLSDVLHQCGSGLQAIGYAQQTYELIIEKSTLAYFQQLLDTDIPAIKKSKALLSRLTLDMDATRSRQQSANKESSNHPSSHNQNKTDSLNNDLEDAEHKVATCKDQYATEMLTFISKEAEICQKIIEWMDAQVSFHRSSLEHLEDMLPDLKCMIEQHSTRPVYGCPLDEHLQSIGKEIALVIETCIGILFHDGLEEEGLFRIAGSASKLKKLKAAFNVGTMIDMEEYYSDFHVVAGALKQYIRELPEPLLTFDLFEEFMQCMSVKGRDARLQQLWTVVNKLPKTNLANVKYLIKFLAKLAEKSDINKMTPSNIAIVFGPNLLWSQNEDDGTNVAMSAVQNQVVETLVQNHDYFFPGDFEVCESLATNSHDKMSTASDGVGVSVEQEHGPKSTNSASNSVNNSLVSGLNTSSTSESVSSHSQMSCSTDALGQSGDTVIMRKKGKSSRLSFPSALNNASDKIFGKKKSIDSIKYKTTPLNENEKVDRKDKRRLRELFGIRKSLSKDKLKELSQSYEDGLNSSGLAGPEFPTNHAQPNDDNQEGSSGQVTFKPRYTPLCEKQLDFWLTGAPDAPLASAEGDDSPMYIEPPTRSFPLSSTSLPHRVHSDMYNTAFALASLKCDGSSDSGLEYLSKVHCNVKTAYLSTATTNDKERVNPRFEDVEFADVDSITSNPRSSPQRMLSFGHSAPSSAEKPDETHPPITKTKLHAEQSMSGGAPLSTSQHSLASTDSSTNGSVYSPSTLRKNKKHAPPPPSIQSPPPHKDPLTKPERPDVKPPDTPATRHDSVKKPTIPPPMPPSKPFSRPNNPPPPTPPTATNQPHINSSSSSVESGNPFLEDVDNVEPSNVIRSLSDGAQPEKDPLVKSHTRNASVDITINQSPLVLEVKGHNRAKSHDFRLRQPPPIPQRTHSIPAKHSTTAKRLAMQPNSADSLPRARDSAPPSLDTPDNTNILIDIGPTSPSGSLNKELPADIMEADEVVERNLDYHDRMNSQSDATVL